MDSNDKTKTVVATVLITCFVLFVLSMCSHRPTSAELQRADQHDSGADYR